VARIAPPAPAPSRAAPAAAHAAHFRALGGAPGNGSNTVQTLTLGRIFASVWLALQWSGHRVRRLGSPPENDPNTIKAMFARCGREGPRTSEARGRRGRAHCWPDRTESAAERSDPTSDMNVRLPGLDGWVGAPRDERRATSPRHYTPYIGNPKKSLGLPGGAAGVLCATLSPP